MSALTRFHLGALVVLAAVAALLITGSPAGAAPYTAGGVTTSATLSAPAVAPGDTVTITVDASAAPSVVALVDIEVYSPSGVKVFQEFHDNESLSSSASTYTADWDVSGAAATGEYAVRVGVFTPGWAGLLHWNHFAASVTVGDLQVPVAELDVASLAIAPGGTADFTVTLSGGNAPVLVDLEIYGPGGGLVNQQSEDNVSASGGDLEFQWTAPSSAAEGNYTISIGVFAPGWGQMYEWHHHVGNLWVSDSPMPAPPDISLEVPASVGQGQLADLTVTLTGANSAPVLMDIEIHDPDGTRVDQLIEENVSVGSSGVLELSISWTPSPTATPGTYTIDVGIFTPGWVSLYDWYEGAGTIEVTDSGGSAGNFEVWTTIQGTHEIHVLAPVNGEGDNMEVVDVIDYKELTGPGGQWEDTNLLNPHMVLFGLHGNPGSEYAYVSNVSSANTSIIDASAREVVAVLNTGTRTHAVQPSPDGSRALAAAIGAVGIDGCREEFTMSCGQIAEIITDTDNAQFTVGRTYDWSDFPEDSGWEGLVRFDPICASWTPDSRFAYVTLASGGLVVFELNEDPSDPLFDVVRVFPVGTGRGEVAPNGCGVGYSTDGRLMFANSATATASYYYTFNLRNHRMTRSVDVSNIVSDIHGMMLSPLGDEVVMVGRLSDNFIVLNQRTGAIKRNRTFDLDLGGAFVSSWTQQQNQIAQASSQTIALRSDDTASSFYCSFEVPAESGGSGLQPISQFQTVDPAPDLVDFSPDGEYIYVTLRGPNPATSGAHATPGFPPGVVVIDFSTGETVQVVELPGNQQQQDPHGIAVRRMGGE